MAVTGSNVLNLSLSEAWASLSEPVLVLAEELAMRRAATAAPPLTLHVSAGGIDAVRIEAGVPEVLFSVAGRPQQAIHDVVTRLAGQAGPGLAMAFAADQAVGQRISLPQQPADILKAMVRNKVESLAPWPLAQCLWGMRVAAAESDSRHVTVDVAVLSRAVFDDLAVALRSGGAEVKLLTVALPDGGQAEIELGGIEIRREAREHAVRLARTAASAVLLTVCLGAWWIFSTASQASHLSAKSDEMMALLRPGGVPAGEPPLITAANRLQEMRRARPPVAAVLDELSKLLPDNDHLVALTLDGGELDMKGQGSGVPGLISILEASPLFKDVNFAAATEADQNGNADAFAIKATLEAGRAAGGAP